MRRIFSMRGALRLTVAAAIVVLAGSALAAPVWAAAAPVLVKNINATGSSNPSDFAMVGSTLFFAADDGVHGVELWKSNGTAAGTKLVKDIRLYGKSSYPGYLTSFNGKLYFMANDGKHGQELWTSDGTKAGTVMVKDIHAGPKNQFGGNSTMLHQAPVVIGSKMFLIVDACCVGTSDVFVSDGSAAGTVPLTYGLDYGLELPDTDVSAAHAYAGKLYFVCRWDTDYQLWVSDGTVAGTHQVAGTPSDANEMSILPASGQSLYLYANDRLWKTDGSPTGTKALTNAGQLESMPIGAAYMNDRLYFATAAIDGAGLWRTNGTASGTVKILDGSADWLAVANNRLFFSHAKALWVTDGTTAGSHALKAFGNATPLGTTAVGSKVVFGIPNFTTGAWSLWASDGTSAGTSSARTFTGTGEREWQPLGLASASKFYFGADDGTHGSELWSYIP